MQNQDKSFSILFESKLQGLGTNRALDSVLPLLLLANRMSKIQNISQEQMAILKERFINDILSISSKLASLEIYDEDDITRLRYCICVFIDESLMKNEIFINSFWANNTLTIRLFNENLGGNKFFGIMDKWFENPTKNKDFLEVVYACLILGYRGKYDLENDCNEKIGYLCESIASAITPLIGSDEETMFKKAYTPLKPDSILSRFNFGKSKIGIIALALLAIVLSFIYSIYSLDKENIKNNTSINNKIDIFMKDSN
ncbi:MAG: type IVB secretion system protein IcmH/DotU [Campylobacter sp.]|nr:type IVB secretion system protein IcmH/DotU [Campylobacter sp.]